MPTRPQTHPSPVDLAAYALGKLPDAVMESVARHLETCAECRRAVATAPADSFLKLVEDVRPSSGAPSVGSGTLLPGGQRKSASTTSGPPLPAEAVPPALASHPKFQVVRVLGRGAMGTVYLAEHRVMQRPVAIKVINQTLLDHPDALPRFYAEVRAAARLHHPNIVTAFDAEQAGDVHLLVMEYVDGVDLAKFVEQRGPLPVEQACHFARQAALGLQHAHEQGMVHRDIKPQNLMLTRKGQVKILDFGLARLASERGRRKGMTQAGSFMGTPEYVAPEQATDASTADIRADIYSLGCTLYCLLTGHPPFQEETAVKLVLAHLQKKPASLHELQPQVPARLSAAVATMLVKDPGQRFQTPGEVAKALAPFSTKQPQRSPARNFSADVAEPNATRTGSVFQGLGAASAAGQGSGRNKSEVSRTAAMFTLEDHGDRPRKHKRKVSSDRVWKWLAIAGFSVATVLAANSVISNLRSGHGRDSESQRESVGESTTVGTGQSKAGAVRKLPQANAPETAITNSIGMELVFIPPGTFTMGSPAQEKDRDADEGPQREVTISRPFYLGKYEVTQGEYLRLMGPTNPSSFSSLGARSDRVSSEDTSRYPVESVSWDDAVEFCRRLSQAPEEKQAGRHYRLPTEAQWEYACRAGAMTLFNRGQTLNNTQANCSEGLSGQFLDRTCRVGSYEPNAWGLHDMHGNVSEWCADWFGEYSRENSTDPQGPLDGGTRVIRGGSWFHAASRCRSAYRSGGAARSFRDDYIGFRVALDLFADGATGVRNSSLQNESAAQASAADLPPEAPGPQTLPGSNGAFSSKASSPASAVGRPEVGRLATAGDVLMQKLAGTKWINSNEVTFEWTRNGRLLHKGIDREWRVLGAQRAQIVFGPDHIDTLVFNASFTKFTQYINGGTSFHEGRRVGR